MAFSSSHKTVFVMDRSPYFLDSCRQPVDFENLMKVKAPGLPYIPQICKSLWTCNIEAVLEYVRIVYDLFPTDKLIQILVSDVDDHALNSWSEDQQNLQLLMTHLAELPQIVRDKATLDECNLMRGIARGVEILTHTSSKQRELALSGTKVVNRGRIIVLSAFNGEPSISQLEDRMHEVIAKCNRDVTAAAAGTDLSVMPIDECDLVLVDITTVGQPNNVAVRHKRQLSPLLSSEVHISQSGSFVAIQLIELAIKHYQLSSTTVTGIPMKEEQNASSSANYDVELLHPAAAHNELFKSGQHVGLMMPSKEGLYSPTVTLKWCTPKSTAVELHHCTSAYRVTPVDVISRPSSCLTNFLLNGRSVMLEQPRKNSTKLISHMLTSHAGEIYLHVLATARSILEDVPSISEGVGGRVTDYRITEFAELIRANKLAPVPPESSDKDQPVPIERARSRIERMTRVCPLAISDTILFNMTSNLEPLPSLIIKTQLTDSEVLECKKVIYHFVGMESRNEALPASAAALRSKGAMKRDEQYRQMWAEFERYIRAYAHTSTQHGKVLDCLLECKKPSSSSSNLSPDEPIQNVISIKEESNSAADSILSKLDSDRTERGLKRELETSLQEQPERKKLKSTLASEQGQSVLSLWTNRITAQHKKKCLEFSGRAAATGNKAELYQNLKEQQMHSGESEGRIHNISFNRNRT